MSWEKHGSHQYYYRVQRDRQGRLHKQYYGAGAAAQRAAQEDDHQRALRKQDQHAQHPLHRLEAQLAALTHVTQTFVMATLLGQGFHQHQRGAWRKRRPRTTLQPEGAFAMEEHTLPVESGTSYDTLTRLMQHAQQGDLTILPVLRTLLDQVTALWEDSRVLAQQVERAWMTALSGHDLLRKEMITREVEALRHQLLGAHPTPLDKLLVDRICACWLAVHHAELHAATRFKGHAVALSPAEEHRLDKVHHRFLTAVRELARVRKLLQPTARLQVNLGTHQMIA